MIGHAVQALGVLALTIVLALWVAGACLLRLPG
jgi:hypothetical protein